MKNTEEFIESNLPRLCFELLDWDNTGLLNGGKGGKVRELAKIIKLSYPESVREDLNSLKHAENMIKTAAMKRVSQS